MTIHIPRAVLVVGGVLLAAYLVYEEGPPLYRYVTKFEAM